MALSITTVEGIGQVRVYRRRGLKNMRITVEHDGSVRLSIPWYVPKSAGLRYLYSKKVWVNKHQANGFKGWQDGQRLTKDYILKVTGTSQRTRSLKEQGVFIVNLPDTDDDTKKQEILDRQITKFLKQECEDIIVPRLVQAAKSGGYEVNKINVKKLKSRWGSCSHKKDITLNSSLARLPSELSDYVIYHELAHTRHLNHGKSFWQEVGKNLPDYTERRKKLRNFNPAAIS